jgi:elongation factor Ts
VAEISAQAVKELRDRTGAGMMECKKALAEASGQVERAIELLRERGLAKAVKRAGRETSEGTIGMALNGRAGALVELGCETDFVAKTPDFLALAASLARLVSERADLQGPEALEDAVLDGEKVRDRIALAVGKIGENIVPKRVARLALEGPGLVGGYVHAGGKLGVLIGLATTAKGEALETLAKDLAMHVAAADPSPLAVDREGLAEDTVQREREILRRQAEQEGKPPAVTERIVEGRIRKFYGEVCLLEQPFVKDPDRTVGTLLEQAGKSLGETRVTGFVRFKLGEATEK